jgi:hypothetical protein
MVHHEASVPEGGGAEVHLDHVDVVFQDRPGADASPITGLRVRLDGALQPSVTGLYRATLGGGDARVELLAPGGGDAVLATFDLFGRAGLPAAPAGGAPDTLHDVRVALNHLGYNAGAEGWADEESDEVTRGEPDPALERAVLCFEADTVRSRAPEGILRRVHQSSPGAALATRVVDVTRERLRSTLEADLGAAPPPSDDVEAGGLGVGLPMPRPVAVLGKLRIVLVSITRDHLAPPTATIDGLEGPNFAAPYVEEAFVDDRDYAGGHRGPMVSVMETDADQTYQVRVVRENLVSDAPLHLVSCDELAVTTCGAVPAGSSAAATFTVRAGAANGQDHRPIDLLVKLGDAAGPTVHCLRVLVLRPMDVRVDVIAIRHDSADTSWISNPRVRDTFRRVDRLYRQAGIRFVFDGEVEYVRDEDYPYGTETTMAALDRMLTVRHYPDRLNVYVSNDVGYFRPREGHRNPPLAIGQSIALEADQTAIFCQPSAFAATLAIPHVLAHELGHALGLVHPDQDDLADQDEYQRCTAWTLRRFMYYHTHAPSGLPAWHEFSSGREAGNMLTSRNLGQDALDNEVRRLRDRVARGAGAGGIYDGVSTNVPS